MLPEASNAPNTVGLRARSCTRLPVQPPESHSYSDIGNPRTSDQPHGNYIDSEANMHHGRISTGKIRIYFDNVYSVSRGFESFVFLDHRQLPVAIEIPSPCSKGTS